MSGSISQLEWKRSICPWKGGKVRSGIQYICNDVDASLGKGKGHSCLAIQIRELIPNGLALERSVDHELSTIYYCAADSLQWTVRGTVMRNPVTPSRVICYVTDAEFAIPSLISAMTARRWISETNADIYLITMGLSDGQVECLMALAEPQHIQIRVMNCDPLTGFDRCRVNKTHVPVTTLGRLFLHEVIPLKYDTMLYMDGDTLVRDDITPLVSFRPPARFICAAEDPSYFYRHDLGKTGRRVREYFSGIGLDGSRGYFNAGVVLSRMDTWISIAREAFEFFCANVERCRFHDQSALNAVAQTRRLRLSSRWDFMTDFKYWNVEAVIEPRILHFTGFAKPWMGAFFPWSELSEYYMRLWSSLGATSFVRKQLEPSFAAQVERENREKCLRLSTVFRHRLIWRRWEMLRTLEPRSVI
jgi:lipopolysaccharide biosynthesis glycosyltransferase